MRPERYSYQYNDRPGRHSSWRSRALPVLLLLLGLTLLGMARAESPYVASLRAVAMDTLAPILRTLASPVHGVRNWMDDKASLLSAHEDNQRLRAENDTLRAWETLAHAVQAENDALRALANYTPVTDMHYVTARVIAQSPSAYAGTLMIDAGSAQGLGMLMPVIDETGLIGRLIEVGTHSARVQLISDPGSRIPIVIATSRQQAILAGTGEALLHLTFITGNTDTIRLGDPVMTTAQGGLIPESIMVGTVFRRDQDGTLRVQLPRPVSQPEFIRVMVAR
jgi:rod shape-determining protein MreC